jgi:cyclophilin family peptidyl-prolyl cis-trans isomerase/HEAT repeat protein
MMNIFFLCFPLFLAAQTQSEFSIRLLQDKRTEQSSELFSFLNSANERERELALLAIANIQDTTAVEEVVPLLDDHSSKVRRTAAFALAMIGRQSGVNALFKRLSVEKNEQCVSEILNAIGLCGNAGDLDSLISYAKHSRYVRAVSVVNAIRRFAVRRIKNDQIYPFLMTQMKRSETVYPAMYSLMTYNDSLIATNYSNQILPFLTHTSPEVRMWSASILANTTHDTVHRRLLKIAIADKDWRVRVNAIRALRNVQSKQMQDEIFSLIRDSNEHVALTSLAVYDAFHSGDAVFSDSTKYLTVILSKEYTPSVQEEMRKIVARKMGERAIPLIGSWKSDNPYITAQRIRAIGETKSQVMIRFLDHEMRNSKHPVVVIAAIEALQSIAHNGSDSSKKEFLKSVLFQFSRNDPGVAYTVAGVFQDTSFSRDLRRYFLPSLIAEYQSMYRARDLEPMIEMLNVFANLADSSALPAVEKGLAEQEKEIHRAAEKAYRSITGRESPVRFIKNPDAYKPFFTSEDFNLLSKYSGAEVVTSKGAIRIEFDKEAAPFTVLNFILLAQKKFYDGLSFHRVVSNFVIQGGDPFGNGSGGPNYSIRTEVHPDATYKTGAVGMASAGKDTEGSQWFITHCPTPHLDFRYTIFGYTKDAAVVDKIMVGDRIEHVKLY